VLTERFRQAPRNDVYDRLSTGIMKLHRKTGEQLLTMFRQLILIVHGLIPCRDWCVVHGGQHRGKTAQPHAGRH